MINKLSYLLGRFNGNISAKIRSETTRKLFDDIISSNSYNEIEANGIIDREWKKYFGEEFDLIRRKLIYNPAQRISLNEAIHHKYFSERPYPMLNCIKYID